MWNKIYICVTKENEAQAFKKRAYSKTCRNEKIGSVSRKDMEVI